MRIIHYGLTLDLVKLDHGAKDFITYAQKNGEGLIFLE